ncbi:3'-5' exonuclease [Microvirga guangxiensis]|uniref:DNA polymerase-3 subunit epsilon n=1 Tax=Microvirga guangxiensis TaxID=549386 RepID=A0A1G5LNS5_9HYPH|nr:3'-5' exonuclease [Microvirga guangxiensis]SCZ13890.1 DNA polymerase-3 subunit epsilon [Microvirga guangxiensis]
MRRQLRNLFYRATLGDHAYRFLFEPGPMDEVVVLDCETTGLNPRIDEVIAVAAVMIRSSRIMTSEAYTAIIKPDRVLTPTSIKVHRLRARDVAEGRPMHEVLPELLRFIGGRPIVGYYVDFDVRMLDRYVLRYIEAKLPNRRIEVSEIYYALKYGGAPPGTVLDLRFQSILADLGIPNFGQHDAFNDALMTAMMYVQLRDMRQRGVRIGRERAVQQEAPIGA